MVSFAYGVYKLLFWNNFAVGLAPLIIGLFFFLSLQMIFLGIIGEYIGAIHTFVQNRPLVFEKERINFEFGGGVPKERGHDGKSTVPAAILADAAVRG